MTAKISVQEVRKTFPLRGEEFVALDGVSLDIADNEFVTVVGPSGCGKSTLMNILAGLETPTSGRALVDGKDVVGPGPERGVIFQQYAPFPWLTVRKNVEFGLKVAGLGAAELIAAQEGLGYRMQQAQLYYDLATIFVSIVVIGVLGLVMDRLLLLAETRLTGWQERR